MPQEQNLDMEPLCPPKAESVEEEERLTFQVALIGSDGLIVGSDRRKLHVTRPTNDEHGSLQPEQAFKFSRSKDDVVICAFAGGDCARDAAEAIANDPAIDFSGGVWEFKQSMRRVLHRMPISGNRQHDQIIVVRKSDWSQVFAIERNSPDNSPIDPISEWITTGNNGHPARFLLQHFRKNLPIVQLKKLALLTLEAASRESHGLIGAGYDLLLLNSDGARFESYEEGDAKILRAWESFERATEGAIYGRG